MFVEGGKAREPEKKTASRRSKNIVTQDRFDKYTVIIHVGGKEFYFNIRRYNKHHQDS